MSIETIIILSIVGITILFYLLHIFSKNKNNRFAHFINRLWDEWLEEQWNGMIAFILIIAVILFIALIFRI